MKAGGRTKAHAISDDDYRALAAFRHALRQFLAFSEDAAREIGLTPQQHQALLAIKGHASGTEVTIGDIAGHLLIRHNSAVELVNRLVVAKLVRKTAAKEDKRRVVVALTAHAEALLRDLSAAHLLELQRSGAPLMEMARRLEKK
ncbi:MAG TPA: helix-turn-helix domain-containing protein [Parvibaculum sp.]